MTEEVHLRCDRCGIEVDGTDLGGPRDWAYVAVGLKRFHYCAQCWKDHKPEAHHD